MSESSNVSSPQIVTEIPSQGISNDKEDSYNGEILELHQFPEGDTAAWCTVIGGALVLFCGFGYNMSFGVYQDFYTLHYLTNKSPSEISWIGSSNTFLGTGMGIVAGVLHDHGYFYHLLIGGSLLQSISLFMLSLTRPGQYYPILLAQGIGQGMGQGIVYVPAMAVVSQHFRRHRTLAMSLVTCGSALGSIIHPIMLNYLFNRSVGFANGVRISAALLTVLLLIACLLMRTRPGPPRRPPSYLSVGRGIIHDIPFCIMCAGQLFFHIGYLFPIFYLQLDSVKHGNSEIFSFYSLVLLNAGNLTARLSSGFIEHRVGVVNMMILATAGCGIVILGMIGLNGVATVVILGMTYGYFSGIHIALLAPLLTYLTSDLSVLGARIGIGMLSVGIGDLLSGPIAGALLTPRYEWLQVSLFNGFIALFGSLLLVMMKIVLRRRQKRAAMGQDHEASSLGGRPR